MFAVDDLDDTLARLREHGAQLVDEVVQLKDVSGSAISEAPRAYSSGWPSKSADAKRALGRHSGTLAHASPVALDKAVGGEAGASPHRDDRPRAQGTFRNTGAARSSYAS